MLQKLMKGEKFSTHGHKLVYPVAYEIKRDDIRVHVVLEDGEIKYYSYAGKPLYNLEVYSDALSTVLGLHGLTELDCGIIVNGEFTATKRYVRSHKVPADLVSATLTLWVYDIPESDYPYRIRKQLISTLVSNMQSELDGCDNLYVCTPNSRTIYSEADLYDKFNAVRALGHEGLMVKTLNHTYKRGRGAAWIKMKPSDDADGVILGFKEAVSKEGVPLGRAGSVHVKVDEGSEAWPAGLDHVLAEDMWQNPNKYIGQWCEFTYMERDTLGGYRHPAWGRLRDAK